MFTFCKLVRAVLLSMPLLTCAGVLRAEIRELPVPAQTITPRSIIRAGDIVYRKFRTTETSVRGIALDAGQILGLQARRRLVAGRPVPLAALGKAVLVERGTRSLALFALDGLSINASLIALEEGSAGDVIMARNPESGIVVQATVSADGTLRVGDP